MGTVGSLWASTGHGPLPSPLPADRALQAQRDNHPDETSLQTHQYQRASKAREGQTLKVQVR